MRKPFLVLVLVVAGSAAGGGAVRWTNRDSFCGSCHSMKEIHETWANSPHAHVPEGMSPAGCVDCHVRPGAAGLVSAKLNGLNEVLIEYTHPTLSTAVAAPHYLPPANCMACHADVIERDARVKVRTGGLKTVGLRFPHGLHLAMAEFTPAMAGRLDDPNTEREEREWIRRAQKADCAACHGPAPRAGDGEAIAAGGPADPAVNFRTGNPMNCVTCHRGVGHSRNPKFGFAVPPVTNCAQCHTGRYHGTLGIVFEADCRGGTDDAACLKCHPGISRKMLEKLPLGEER